MARHRRPLRSLSRQSARASAIVSLIAGTMLLDLPAASIPPTETLNQIDTTAGGPGLGSNPTAVSEGPSGVAVHGVDVYIADTTMGVVRDYNTSSDTMSVLTGNGEGSFSGTGGPAGQAGVGYPFAVATDAAGDVFFLSSTILEINSGDGAVVYEVPAATGSQFGQAMTAGHIYTVAGTDAPGSSGLTGPAPAAQINAGGIAVDAAGDLFIADTANDQVLYVPTTTCVSSCIYGLAGFTDGDIYQVAGDGTEDYSSTTQQGDGEQATAASLWAPGKVAVNSAGDIFIADSNENRVREVNTAGVISTFTGSQGTGLATGIGQSPGPVVFADGSLYVEDTSHMDIRKIDPSTGVETLVAGVGEQGYTGDSDPTQLSPTGVLATQAELGFGFGEGMAVDSMGDVFFVQNVPTGEVIRVVPGATRTLDGYDFTQGYIYTVVGDGQSGNGGSGGPAPLAALGSINQLTFDNQGDLLLVDSFNDIVQLVATADCSASCPYGLVGTKTGYIFTIAGDGSGGYTGDSGPATSATLAGPQGIAVDGSGNLFIGDTNNNVVRKVTPAGTISTYAGSTLGTAGSTGNGGPALSALFNFPTALSGDGAGNLYVADVTNDQVREIGVSGSHTVTAAAGSGSTGFSGDGSAATTAQLNLSGAADEGVAMGVDSHGDLYIADTGNARVREVLATGGLQYGQTMASGDIYTVAGNGTGDSGDTGPASAAEILGVDGIMSDAGGDVYLFEEGKIREVAGTTGTQWGQSMTAGDIYTMAGNGTPGSAGDGGPALSASFGAVQAMALDVAGDMYVVDQDNQELGLRKISNSRSFDINIVTGNQLVSYSGDGGPATSAQLNTPGGTAVDHSGDLFIVDGGNSRIRVKAAADCASSCPFGLAATTAGDIYTIAGDGMQGSSGDGIPATSAALGLTVGTGIVTAESADVAVDPAGNVLFTDGENNKVRLIAVANCSAACSYGLGSLTAGDIYTVAGDGTAGTTGDGAAAIAAELNGPEGVAVDPTGAVFIADANDALVRMIAPANCSSACPLGLATTVKGDIYTVAGNGTTGATGDGGPATSAELGTGERVAADPRGDLLIADQANAEVRLVAASTCSASCPYGLASTTKGDIYTIAGDGTPGSSVVFNAPATTAELDWPDDLAVAPDGTLYIGECLANDVRSVSPSGTINYAAGNGQEFQPLGDGGLPTQAGLSCGLGSDPYIPTIIYGTFGMTYDAPRGNLYIADPNNQRVRVVGVETSVADTVFTPASLVGGNATSWSVDFTTSSRGALTGGSGTVTLTAPPGTTLPTVAADYTVNSVPVTVTPNQSATNNVTLTVPSGIGDLTGVTVGVSSVTNPPAAHYPAIETEVTTTSDPQPGIPVSGLTFTSVGSVSPPSITKSFGVASMPLNGFTSLGFSITNPGTNAVALTGVAFTDTLPAGLVVSTPNGLTGSCGGGTITATAGASSVSLAGATLGVGASCTFS
ncbi:MAG TPA: hypothetical protein VND70_00660, partial [Acidimicrobiales bacterium]|nr:hypothetical protein [Acidimicrobiales bacterium]